MSKYLPERIFPLRLAESGQRLAGCISTQSMTRLKQELIEPIAEVTVAFCFATSRDNVRTARGEIRANLTFTCQRCLEPVAIPIVAPVAVELRLAGEEDTQALEKGTDIIEVSEDTISLTDWVEDELLLAIPFVPVHDHDCTPLQAKRFQDNGDAVNENANPFAILSSLKKHC